LLKKHTLAKGHIDAFAVASGPGSFTGLRVGLAAIKALAEILHKPIAAVSLLEAIARAAATQGRVFSAVARVLLPIRQRDTQAGLKGMTATVAERIVPELGCDGFGLDCELLTACARSGVPVVEVPVHVRYDSTASTTGPRATLRMLRELWQIRRAWRTKSVPVSAAAPEPVPLPKAA